MANTAYTPPNLLTDPGYLYYAPLGSTIPANTVSGSVFTDTWPVAWVQLGLTDAGTKFSSAVTVQPITSAEIVDPVAFRTTDRTSSVTFMLMNVTATNLSRTLNGAVTTVTGTAGTTLTRVTPPTPGQEVRCMIGFESTDSTLRFIAYQVINSGSIDLDFGKTPAHTALPWAAMLEKPATTQPYDFWIAGSARA